MNTITLDSLIDRGKNILDGITKNPPHPNVISFTVYYSLQNILEYETWKNDVVRFISKYYPQDISIQTFKDAIVEFEKCHNSPRVFNKMLGILESCKKIPQVAEPNTPSNHIGTQVNVHQHQEQLQQQTQSIQIFIEAIQDELTGKQQKELAALAKEELPEAEKRTKIIDKITSFGSDVAANIIANIVTNPAIWG